MTCFLRFGVSKTTVDDIASEAQISRTTLYKHFRGKTQLIVEISIRETRKINALTKGFHSQFDNIDESIVETMLFAVNEAKKNPIIEYLISASPDILSEILDRSEEIWALQTEEWMHLYQAAHVQSRLRPGVTAGEFARWITTMQHILLSRPLLLGGTPEAQRSLLHTFFAPSLFTDR